MADRLVMNENNLCDTRNMPKLNILFLLKTSKFMKCEPSESHTATT
jgi:hypothetical protein